MHCTMNIEQCNSTEETTVYQSGNFYRVAAAAFCLQQHIKLDLFIPPEGGKIPDVATASNNTLCRDLFSLIIFTFLKVEWLRAMDFWSCCYYWSIFCVIWARLTSNGDVSVLVPIDETFNGKPMTVDNCDGWNFSVEKSAQWFLLSFYFQSLLCPCFS